MEEVQKNNVPCKKSKKVGSFTFGITLIFSGILLLISIFNNNFDLLLISKISPIFLIVLGIEIRINYFSLREYEIKYDFWGLIMCLFVVGASTGLSVVSVLVARYSNYIFN